MSEGKRATETNPRWDLVFSRGEAKCFAKPKSQILMTGGLLPSRRVLSSFRSLQASKTGFQGNISVPYSRIAFLSCILTERIFHVMLARNRGVDLDVGLVKYAMQKSQHLWAGNLKTKEGLVQVEISC